MIDYMAEISRLRSQRDFWIRQAMAFSEHADNMRIALLEPAAPMLCEPVNYSEKPQSCEPPTDAEVEAVKYVEFLLRCEMNPNCKRHIDALREFLKRTGNW